MSLRILSSFLSKCALKSFALVSAFCCMTFFQFCASPGNRPRYSLFCTRLRNQFASSRLFKHSPNLMFFTSCVRGLNCADAPSTHMCFHSCPMRGCGRDRLFSASVDFSSLSFNPFDGNVVQTLQVRSHAALERSMDTCCAQLVFEFRAKIHSIITATTNLLFLSPCDEEV